MFAAHWHLGNPKALKEIHTEIDSGVPPKKAIETSSFRVTFWDWPNIYIVPQAVDFSFGETDRVEVVQSKHATLCPNPHRPLPDFGELQLRGAEARKLCAKLRCLRGGTPVPPCQLK